MSIHIAPASNEDSGEPAYMRRLRLARSFCAYQQSVFNLYMFHHFPKNLDRTITFNSVSLKNTQTEPQKYTIFFQQNE